VEPESLQNKPRVLVILGPTGIGKTKVSLFIAQKFDGEIVSADAMQIYKVLGIRFELANT
jgi:tRNA dimethylallyltransferase